MSDTEMRQVGVQPARRAAQKANCFIRAVMNEDDHSGSDDDQIGP